jgi:hypothetical protein
MTAEISDGIMKNIAIDDRLDSYKPFFDHEWARRILDLTANTLLDPIAFDLTLAFRGIVNTHVLGSSERSVLSS